jgi:hypothetical protein
MYRVRACVACMYPVLCSSLRTFIRNRRTGLCLWLCLAQQKFTITDDIPHEAYSCSVPSVLDSYVFALETDGRTASSWIFVSLSQRVCTYYYILVCEEKPCDLCNAPFRAVSLISSSVSILVLPARVWKEKRARTDHHGGGAKGGDFLIQLGRSGRLMSSRARGPAVPGKWLEGVVVCYYDSEES